MGRTHLLPLVTRNFIIWISSPASLCSGLVCILTDGYWGFHCFSVSLRVPDPLGQHLGGEELNFTCMFLVTASQDLF